MKRLPKTVIGLLLISSWGTVSSCTSETATDTYLQQDFEHLEERTIPADSRVTNQHLPATNGWGAHAEWEFQTNDSVGTYIGWVAGQLRPDFQIQESAGTSTRFSKYDHGDVEILSVATAPSAGMLRVNVNLEIYPD